MTCTEEYQERIEYTFHAFCKVAIRNAMYTALRTRSRKNKREISLDYLTDEKHYPLGTEDEYFIVPEPDEQYTLILCGDTVLFDNALLVEALSRLPAQEREMVYLSFFKRIPQYEIGRRYGRSRSAAGYHIRRIRYAALVDGQADKDIEEYITETLLKALFKFRFLDSPSLTTE